MKPHKLLALLRDNAANARAHAPRAETGTDGAVHLYLYDVIDAWWGASAQSLVDQLAAAGSATVHLHINSPGGDVFEGRAMASAVVAYPGQVITHIDGLAASAATYVALAGSEVRISDGAMLMIHNSWTLAMGDATELVATADLLRKIDGTIAADYARRTGASSEQVAAWMNAETWFTAQEAMDAKFVDAIDANTKQGDGSAAARWNLQAYANVPQALARPAQQQRRTPGPLNSAESDFLSSMVAHWQGAVQTARAFVAVEPQATLREYAEDVVEDCAGELELLRLWQQVGPAADSSIDDQARRQLQMNRNRLRIVAPI